MASAAELGFFKYTSLTEPDSFRLILLQPASTHGADLQCTLLHTSLSQCDRDIIDHYTALSYVWGDPTQTGHIYVDGYRFTITTTLEAAFRDLRDPSRVLRIWADAVCIDQSNLAERSSQVGIMAQIYSSAHHTVIHLGPLIKGYETILRAAPSNTTGVLTNHSTTASLVKLAENGLLRLPWFRRVWIFQELVLSRDPWVQCGSLRARWTDLCNILLAPNASIIRNGRTKELQVLADMNYTRGVWKQKMIVHLSARRGLGATDPKDMIFAHLGLAADLGLLKRYVEVDYTKSCAAVYEDAARFLLDEIGPEGPVKFFPHTATDQRSKIEGLASWAPDWSLPSSGLEPMYRDNLVRRNYHDAKPHYAFVSQPLVLAYIGYEVDVVSDFSLVLPDPSKLDMGARERYQKVADDLETLYGSGAWWSGDENGQHRHIDLRGKEEQHEKLCLKLAEEWLLVMNNDLLRSTDGLGVEEVETHKLFLSKFSDWLQGRAKQGLSMVGSDSDGIESLMWQYLRLKSYPTVLTGRRFAITKSGKVGIVPKQVRNGDAIVYLAGSLVSLVLRPDPEGLTRDLALEIRDAFEKKNDESFTPGRGTRLPCDMENVPLQKCSLVGECYIEGEVGWKYGEDRKGNYTIYALR